MKSGWKTSEFWATAVIIVAALVMLVICRDQPWVRAIISLGPAAAVGVYTWTRARAKAACNDLLPKFLAMLHPAAGLIPYRTPARIGSTGETVLQFVKPLSVQTINLPEFQMSTVLSLLSQLKTGSEAEFVSSFENLIAAEIQKLIPAPSGIPELAQPLAQLETAAAQCVGVLIDHYVIAKASTEFSKVLDAATSKFPAAAGLIAQLKAAIPPAS